MSATKTPIVEVKMEKVEELLARLEGSLSAEDMQLLHDLLDSHRYITDLIGDKKTTIDRLRKMLFGTTTEKTRTVLGGTTGTGTGSKPEPPPAEEEGDKEPAKGHGRNGADDYPAAERVPVKHTCLKPGDPCPACERGKLYPKEPVRLVRLVGQPPVGGRIFELERLRCNLCGRIFCADAPAGVGKAKYDETVTAMVALLKYGTGLPFYRLQGLQRGLGIPLPATTQWDIVKGAAEAIEPVFEELIRQAAQGDVVHNDDTTMRVRELAATAAGAKTSEEGRARERTGVFTSGIVSETEGRKIAIFVTGAQHAGENLKDLLEDRALSLRPPIQMCDALSRNMPAELRTIIANCLAHARRKFVEVVNRFPGACRYVIESLREVYCVDADAKERGLSPEDRLALHQEKSGPVMAALKQWMTAQFEERRVEPNSALGDAIAYMQDHWEKLTLFLREPGAPLDNNVCERALKKAILHRKNALFYKTLKGAHVGDVFMSLIHTSELVGVSPFDYLTAILRNAAAAGANPADWMPWNYKPARAAAATT